MKKKTIRGAILSLILTLGIPTVAFADGMEMGKGIEKKVDGINVQLAFGEEQAKTGKDEIMITLHDGNDNEIEGATVTVIAEMDKSSEMDMDMGHSEPIEVTLENSEEGQYMGEINFTDEGKWIVTTNLVVNGEKTNVEFNVDVANGGPNWVVIGGFIGIIAAIIIVAAVKKKKVNSKV
ncbi:FixH family protein [Clostridium chromiireducens]|uniref:FixH family protein n=1 Tax=Clostridium chromiireducens TaxID=225345 RepID=UPI003AF9C54A